MGSRTFRYPKGSTRIAADRRVRGRRRTSLRTTCGLQVLQDCRNTRKLRHLLDVQRHAERLLERQHEVEVSNGIPLYDVKLLGLRADAVALDAECCSHEILYRLDLMHRRSTRRNAGARFRPRATARWSDHRHANRTGFRECAVRQVRVKPAVRFGKLMTRPIIFHESILPRREILGTNA